MNRSKGFLLLAMMLLGLFCLSGPSWAEAACPEGELQQSYTGSLLISAKEGDADFIKIDCQSSLPIYASPEKLRCEPETAIDRPGAPGRCPRAGISLPVSKRMREPRYRQKMQEEI